MTEINSKNREAYLNACKTIWDFDEASLKYVEKRTSDEWEPVPELKSLIDSPNSVYEDQRIRFDMDMGNPAIQSFFAKDDNAYTMFKTKFGYAIKRLEKTYSCVIGYKEFIENKVIFKKNQTKIKKVFENIYKEFEADFERDADEAYTPENCAAFIVRQFERIGASKKSAKKLQFVISFNPMDWFLASTAEKFSSCFNLNNEESGGFQYCLGLPFLAGDKNRMMLYITDGSKKEFLGIKVDSVQTRTWCLLDKSGSFNIVKWYPNDTVGITPVVAITGNSKFHNKDTFSRSKYPLDVLSTKKGAVIGVYSDMGKLTEEGNKLWIIGHNKDGQQVFTKNLIEVTGNSRSSFTFEDRMSSVRRFGFEQPGFKIGRWKQLGLHVDLMFPTLRCKKCGEDKGGIVLRNDSTYLCYDCYKDSIMTCDSCGSEFVKSDEVPIVETINGKKIHLCPTCYSKVEKRTCSCCGKYSPQELLKTDEGNKICNVCLDTSVNGYTKCDKCGNITKNIKFTFNTALNEKTTVCKKCEEDKDEQLQHQQYFGKYYHIITKKFTSRKNVIE